MPLALTPDAGAKMRQAMGMAVFGGLIGATLLGLILTPVFYMWVQGTVAHCSGAVPRSA